MRIHAARGGGEGGAGEGVGGAGGLLLGALAAVLLPLSGGMSFGRRATRSGTRGGERWGWETWQFFSSDNGWETWTRSLVRRDLVILFYCVRSMGGMRGRTITTDSRFTFNSRDFLDH